MTPLHQLAIFAVSAAVFLALGLLAVGGVAFALACIGTEDQDELRPVTVTMAWLRRVRDRIGQALSGEDDLAEDGTPCPNCGRNTFDRYEVRCWACGWDGSPLPGEYEEEEDDAPVPGTGVRGADPLQDAGLRQPLVPGAEGDPVGSVRSVEERRGSGDGSASRGDEPRDRDDDAADVTLSDFDTDTLRIFREAREEHLVPTNEPQPPATAHAATFPPAADGGETPADGNTAGDASGAVDDDPPAPEARYTHHLLSQCADEAACPVHGRNDPPGPASGERPAAQVTTPDAVAGPGVHPDGLGELVEMTVTDPPGPAMSDGRIAVRSGLATMPESFAGPGVRRWVAEFLAADDGDVDAEWLGWMAARLRAVTT